jgi:hypothetical protein
MWRYPLNISSFLALGRVYMRPAGRRNSRGSSRTYNHRQGFLTMPSIKGGRHAAVTHAARRCDGRKAHRLPQTFDVHLEDGPRRNSCCRRRRGWRLNVAAPCGASRRCCRPRRSRHVAGRLVVCGFQEVGIDVDACEGNSEAKSVQADDCVLEGNF